MASKKLWRCPNCGREFERQNQSHSCKLYLLAQHFEGKPMGKALYQKLKQAMKNEMGNFKVESLECCIHFVSTFTFAAVKIFNNKIQVEFSLTHEIESKRIKRIVKMSAHRYLYHVDVFSVDEIDRELLQWIHEAHDLKNEKLVLV
jgi:Domain of unknown function (DUF5655)